MLLLHAATAAHCLQGFSQVKLQGRPIVLETTRTLCKCRVLPATCFQAPQAVVVPSMQGPPVVLLSSLQSFVMLPGIYLVLLYIQDCLWLVAGEAQGTAGSQ